MPLSRHGLTRSLTAILALFAATTRAEADDAPAGDTGPPRLELSLPVSCEPGKTCFIQHYVDVDTGPASRDFACGSATYDGHDGTDFRFLSAAQVRRGVPVLAAADGIVKGLRDGMQDTFVRDTGKAGLAGRECDNGVVLDHGSGWETQYCHMRQGSIRVAKGMTVKRGQQLGDVGYSGLADMAHLHFTVRHGGAVLDPYTGHSQDGSCNRQPDTSRALWDDGARRAFSYANGEIIAADFATRIPGWAELEQDHEAAGRPDAHSDQFVFFARLTNLRGGDRIRMKLTGPDGFFVENTSEPMDRNKAIYASAVGKRLSAPAWGRGTYQGEAQIIRDGSVVAERRAAMTFE